MSQEGEDYTIINISVNYGLNFVSRSQDSSATLIPPKAP
jgi:hypothetical protein